MLFTRPSHWKNKIAVSQAAGAGASRYGGGALFCSRTQKGERDMPAFTDVFQRVEQKYLLDSAQYEAVQTVLAPHMRPDAFGRSTVCGIYFDTPDRRLVRATLEKPVYKEKLRLRTYGVPQADSPAFVELKKKYRGVVYKRRAEMPYAEAFDWLCRGCPPAEDGQILREIAWFLQFYETLEPAAVLCYDRTALYGREDEGLRVTFDEAIRWRGEALDLRCGDAGARLIRDGQALMEVKTSGGMPLWLSDALCALGVYPTSFSKYGAASRCAARAAG